MATCTSGEPVSPSLVAYSVMSVCLRSAVIDIGMFLLLQVQDTHRPKQTFIGLRERDELAARRYGDNRPVAELIDVRPIRRAKRLDSLSMPQAERFGLRQGQCRDVVQRGLDRKQVL